MRTGEKIPKWVYVVVVILALVSPLSHLWMANYPPAGTVPTGLSNADSAIYLQAMRMLRNGFYSPYASCKAPNGPSDIAFLAAPFHWLYALIGVVAGFLNVNDFVFLGLANGIIGAAYLYVVYHFLRAAAPRQAKLAFLLFTLSGGLGGLMYAVTGLLGLHAAIAVSDWALLGAAGGGIYGRSRRQVLASTDESVAWVVPWLLVFTAIAVSAWGQGWFLRLTPQRLMLLLGLPLSILSATALQAWGRRRPYHARGYLATMILCGVASAIAGTLFFQGPLGRAAGKDPFARLHPEIMTPADAELLGHLTSGIVLAPQSFSDAIALRPGMRVLGGIGGTDLSDQMSTEIDPAVARFFSGDPDIDRRAFLDEWCIDYVYCPDTWPVDAEVVAELRKDRRLETVAEKSRGVVFRVER